MSITIPITITITITITKLEFSVSTIYNTKTIGRTQIAAIFQIPVSAYGHERPYPYKFN